MGARVLLYSPDLDGHRQGYCVTWARILRAHGCAVCVAADFAGRPLTAEMESLVATDMAETIDTGPLTGGGVDASAAEIARVAAAAGAEVTVLMEADDHLAALVGQTRGATARIPGRRVGIFLRSTNYVYAGSGLRTPRARAGWLRRLPRDWPSWPRLFHERLLPRRSLLECALCLDELYVQTHPATHSWMPDIFEPLDSTTPNGDAAAPSQPDAGVASVRRFAAAHKGREIFAYFGAASPRRGYDTLLRLAVERRGCMVHCGMRDAGLQYPLDADGLRRELLRRGDIFETGEYVADRRLGAECMTVGPFAVLPYRGHFGSSGVMLQAIAAGRPVLVPDQGLMAHRVTGHALGATYAPGDWADLNRMIDVMHGQTEGSTESLARFIGWFSQSQVEAAVLAAVGQGGQPVELPSESRRLPEGMTARARGYVRRALGPTW